MRPPTIRFAVVCFLLAVVCVCDVRAGEGDGDYYNLCSDTQLCTGAYAECCFTGTNEGECINNQTYTCAACASGGNAICGFGQDCCVGPQGCYSPTENRCCTSAANPFVCHANDTCCASVCCANDMACTAEGVCMDYPKEPLCGQPCLSDSDCGYGGSSCGTCYGFYTAGDPVAAKICVATIGVPINTAGTETFSVQSGDSIVINYTAVAFSASVLQVTAQTTSAQCAASLVSQLTLNSMISSPSGSSTINIAYTNVKGDSVGPGGAWLGLDFYANSNCSATGTYLSSMTPFPTQSLQVDQNSWVGNASTGQLFTFPINGGVAIIDGIQQPFVVSISQQPGGNCFVAPTLTYAGAPSGSQLWQNPVSNLFVPISLYGGAFNASWTAVVYIMSGSCELLVGAQSVPATNFGALYSFNKYIGASYVGCDPTGSSQCNGFTLSGPFNVPTPPAAPTAPPTAAPTAPTPPAAPVAPTVYSCVTVLVQPQNVCLALFNGDPIVNGVNITQSINARVDVFVNADVNVNTTCSGIIATSPGPCATPDNSKRGNKYISIV